MQLRQLIDGIDVRQVIGPADREITAMAYHTRQVRPGALFVAMRGTAADGRTFIPAAVAAGAGAVIAETATPVPTAMTQVIVPDARIALARAAACWYGDPSREVRLVGVTGTNGKTTLTYLLEAIWRAMQRTPGVIGTINVRYAGATQPAPTTTPESLDLQALLHTMRAARVQDVVMEVSSHALTQERVTGCHFDGAIFTNLTQDHLDYHGAMETYAAAKRRLFHEVLPASAKSEPWAVINADDPVGIAMAEGCARVVWYSRCPPAKSKEYGVGSKENPGDWVYAESCECTVAGIRMQVVTPMGRYVVESALRGTFNASNILAAAAAAFAMGLPTVAVQQGVRAVTRVPGRLEWVPNPAGLQVVVDYAHTPDALRNVLGALRELCPAGGPGRLITVFGCGGDRDPTKRPLMGAAVAWNSDVALVTSDNPRTEDPATIIAQIIPGLQSVGMAEAAAKAGRPATGSFCLMVDRAEAIAAALRMATPADLVLIAGKGHEDYQIIGTEKHPFDDREVVREFFNGIDDR